MYVVVLTGLNRKPSPPSTHSRLPVPLSTYKNAVSLDFELVQEGKNGVDCVNPSISQSHSTSILCSRKKLGPLLRRRRRGVGATGAVLAHSSLLVLEGSRISDRVLSGVGSLSTCCEAPLARARLKPSEHHPTGVLGLCLKKKKCATFEEKRPLEQGPNGDLWSILSQLIDGRSGNTDVMKVKSLGGRWPNSCQAKQDRLSPHACKLLGRRRGRGGGETFANRHESGTQSQIAERVGLGVAKRLALVQADIWAKRGEARDMYELDPLPRDEEACTKSAIGRLVDKLAHQGHLLVCHKEGLTCKACNMYRADRQFNFWSRKRCVPRSNAADVISRFRNKKRQHINASTDFPLNSKSGFL